VIDNPTLAKVRASLLQRASPRGRTRLEQDTPRPSRQHCRMNGETHGTAEDDREMAYALVDRTLTAIGGLEARDPIQALDTVMAMYRHALERLSEQG
jgi:hypothetical protein